MRRLLLICVALVAVAAYAVATAGAGEESVTGQRYTVEIDNAFGLVVGGDVKVAGVRAGRVTDMRLSRRTKRALVDIEIDRTGFGSLRTDVFCETRPQSLIGEYFIDCHPGTAREELASGSVIPVAKTATTVPADLVNNIMRRPERERLRIILNEIGAGVGARAEDLNEAVRRASPALRETNRVLAVLGRQNRILRDLVENGDAVITELASNKRDVSRWVRETRETAAASAERRDDIAGNFQRLPEFLRQLRPAMAELGRVADAQRPALADLDASAGQLERLLDNLEPFAKASQANLASLGRAARVGRPGVKAALPLARELDRFSRQAPEAANNADIVTRHLDDRAFAVEKDPRSPGGAGYTGLEALLQYVFQQAMAINIFDANGYMLKVNAFHSECSEYQSAESLKEHMADDPEFYERCRSILGPDQQGITTPDPTARPHPAARKRGKRRARRAPRSKAPETTPQDRPGDRPESQDKPKLPIDLGETLDDLLDGRLPEIVPGLGGGNPLERDVGIGRAAAGSDASRAALLDFLFGS